MNKHLNIIALALAVGGGEWACSNWVWDGERAAGDEESAAELAHAVAPAPAVGRTVTHRDWEGRVFIVAGVNEGQWDGLYQRFHANGRLAESGNYVNGQKQALWLAWYPNGHVFSRTLWDDGIPTGEWTFYHPNRGQPSARFTYEGGRLVGGFETWDREGHLMAKVMFRRTAPH